MASRLTFADLTREERNRAAVAVHEAGHAVMNVLSGGRIVAAVLTDDERVPGATVHYHVPDGRWPSIVFAGPWAEARWRAGRRPTQHDLYTVFNGNGCRDDAALSAAGGLCSVGAEFEPLLERCWPSVTRLASQLYLSGEVRNADVCAALGIPEHDNGFELSLIRSGSAPGSFSVTRPVSV